LFSQTSQKADVREKTKAVVAASLEDKAMLRGNQGRRRGVTRAHKSSDVLGGAEEGLQLVLKKCENG
jgi:hypothetical protein